MEATKPEYMKHDRASKRDAKLGRARFVQQRASWNGYFCP
jgi:hypothetical protein